MLPRTSYTKTLEKKEQTCSSISFYWSLTQKVPELGPHNIFLASSKYSESFDEIFEKGSLPVQPSFYVNVPSSIDSTAAPSGRETLVILVPCGPLRTEQKIGVASNRDEFKETLKRARRQVLETLKERLGRDIEELIDYEIVNGESFFWGGGKLENLRCKKKIADKICLLFYTFLSDPFDWEEKFNLFRGSILGLSHTLPQVLYFRPSIK